MYEGIDSRTDERKSLDSIKKVVKLDETSLTTFLARCYLSTSLHDTTSEAHQGSYIRCHETVLWTPSSDLQRNLAEKQNV